MRAFLLIEDSKWGLTSLRDERFRYSKKYVHGYCLDIGCGKDNYFVDHFLEKNGVGLDLFPYEGLTEENLVENFNTFPFDDETFDTVTFIANFNHIPKQDRDIELAEAFRVLKPGGNTIITMGSPFTELMAHLNVWLQDKWFHTNYDMDNKRGMQEGEAYFVRDKEIKDRMFKAGFRNFHVKYFTTQWWLNHLWVGWKEK